MNSPCLDKIHLGRSTDDADKQLVEMNSCLVEKSIILIVDPAQLPPVGDKPLYHSLPSNPIGEQGYVAYHMSSKVNLLTVNQRVQGSDNEQAKF